MSEKGRFWQLDLLRGVAVFGMIIFHAFFILDFYGVVESNMGAGPWHAFGQVIRYTFLGLVGVGMVISYRRFLKMGSRWGAIRWQWRRAVMVFAAGMLVSLITSVFLPEYYVKFGILHLIGVSIFVLSFLMWNRWVVLVAGVAAFWWGYFQDDGGVFLFVKNWNLRSVDYFPLFPWMGVVALGIFLGEVFYGRIKLAVFDGLRKCFLLRFMVFWGRHALVVYLLHVPILMALFLGFGIIHLTKLKLAI